MPRNWQDSILKEFDYYQQIKKHYIMPRAVGATSFLIQLANKRLFAGDSVAIITASKRMYKDHIRPYLGSRSNSVLDNYMYRDRSDCYQLYGKSYDWVIIDSLNDLRVEDEVALMRGSLPLITKNYIRIDTI